VAEVRARGDPGGGIGVDVGGCAEGGGEELDCFVQVIEVVEDYAELVEEEGVGFAEGVGCV